MFTHLPCRHVVENFLQDLDLATHVAFYPLAKNDDDRQRIKLLVRNLKQGMPAAHAFAIHWQMLSPHEIPGRNGYLAFNLWRNQLHLAKKGATQVPLIISRIPLGDNCDDIPPSPDGCSIFSRTPKVVTMSRPRILLNRFLNEVFRVRGISPAFFCPMALNQ